MGAHFRVPCDGPLCASKNYYYVYLRPLFGKVLTYNDNGKANVMGAREICLFFRSFGKLS